MGRALTSGSGEEGMLITTGEDGGGDDGTRVDDFAGDMCTGCAAAVLDADRDDVDAPVLELWTDVIVVLALAAVDVSSESHRSITSESGALTRTIATFARLLDESTGETRPSTTRVETWISLESLAC